MSVRAVDEFPWEGEYPASETAVLLRYGKDALNYTKTFYEVRDEAGELILGAGVSLWSFARPPELWILLAKPYFVNLRKSLRLTKVALREPLKRYPSLVCEVSKTSARELHFVKHMGWVPTGDKSIRPGGEDFIQFKVA